MTGMLTENLMLTKRLEAFRGVLILRQSIDVSLLTPLSTRIAHGYHIVGDSCLLYLSDSRIEISTLAGLMQIDNLVFEPTAAPVPQPSTAVPGANQFAELNTKITRADFSRVVVACIFIHLLWALTEIFI